MKTAGADSLEMGSVRYERHRFEQTLLDQFVERYYPVFGSALNPNIHFHLVFLDRVCVVTRLYRNRPRFQWVRESTFAQLTQLAHTIARAFRRSEC